MQKAILNGFSLFIFAVSAVWAQNTEDPYLWLEDVDAEKSIEWVKERNAETESAIKKNPVFKEIYEKNLEIYNSDERIAYPKIIGKYIYNFWQDDVHVRGILRRTTLKDYQNTNPNWETVLDIDALNTEENENWVYKSAHWLYPDYNRCLVRLSRGGGDAVVMREFDAENKTFVKDGFYVPEAKGNASWLDINTLFISTNFGEGTVTTSGYPRQTRIWKRGQKLEDAKLLFEGESTDVSVGSYAMHTPERVYKIVYRGMTFYTTKQFVLENDKLILLDIPEDADFQGVFKNQMLVRLKSEWKPANTVFKQGSVISIGYDDFLAGSKDFQLVVEPDDRSSIEAISNTENYLLVNMLTDVISSLYRYKFENGKWIKEKIEAPGFGTIDIKSTDEFSDTFFFTYAGFLSPSSLYLADGAKNKVKKLKSLPDFFDATPYQVEQNFATSKDGTKIPYFLVTNKKIKLDGSNPTLLYGYGGFEISMQPFYSATAGSAWLKRGGVYVLANIRGGGEYGPKWHQAALKENRQLAFDDFIAVAEDLVKRKITSPKHLGIQGGSNGGLLVGAVFTQRPDLFNAVVCRVPLLDMKRFNKLLAGASWMGEYGNPDKPEEWEYIKKYSPYQNVFKDKKYPKVFFNTSTRDDRVHPAHARKMVAKMLDMGHPVFYYENMEGGHAAATNNKQRAYASALIYTYLLEQLK